MSTRKCLQAAINLSTEDTDRFLELKSIYKQNGMDETESSQAAAADLVVEIANERKSFLNSISESVPESVSAKLKDYLTMDLFGEGYSEDLVSQAQRAQNQSNGDLFAQPLQGSLLAEETPTFKAEKQKTTENKTFSEPTPESNQKITEQTSSANKIEDFGEKIEGAKKDAMGRFKDTFAKDVSVGQFISEPFAKLWPLPDYAKLLEEGLDPMAVGIMRAIREEIPTKPRQPFRVAQWASTAEKLHRITSTALNDSNTVKRLIDVLSKTELGSDSILVRAELYAKAGQAISLEGYKAVAQRRIRVEPSSSAELYKTRGDPNAPYTIYKSLGTASNQMPRVIGRGENRAQAIAAAIAFVAGKQSIDSVEQAVRKEHSYEIYSYKSRRNVYLIGKKVGKRFVDLKEFSTSQDARDFLKTDGNIDELDRLLSQAKFIPSERREINQDRIGADHRKGENVTPEQFQAAFGFRGVQFGEYVEQKRRQEDLNQAFDALQDLALVLGLPPKALSLNGELALAFGARGGGGKNAPSAHFEPDKIVINLTKTRGAGSLAHEWWHGLDNYFARKGGRPSGMATETQRGRWPSAIRAEMQLAYQKVIDVVSNNNFEVRSKELDSFRNKDYFSLVPEKTARAFEQYVIEAARSVDNTNDYLANIVTAEMWDAEQQMQASFTGKSVKPYPYALPEEIPAIKESFDNFFATIQSKEEGDKVALFSVANTEFARDSLIEFVSDPDVFRYPKSKSKNLNRVFEDIDPSIEFVGDVTAPDEESESGAESKLLYKDRTGKNFYVYQNGSEVWVDLSRLDLGSQGSAIYAGIANWAFNDDLVFVEDPAGLSPFAMRRRTEMMLSSALKMGSTKHLAPGKMQKKGDDKIGVVGLKWRDGDDAFNLESLLKTARDNSISAVPEISQIRYDFGSGIFVNRDTENPVSNDEFKRWSESAAGRQNSIGVSTLKRAVVIDTLLRTESFAQSGVLAGIFMGVPQRNESTAGLFYSLLRNTDDKASAKTLASIEESVAQALKKLPSAPNVVVLPSFEEAPQSVKDQADSLGSAVEGFFFDGQVYLVASQLKTPTDVVRVLLHEVVGHYGLRGAFGSDVNTILKSVARQKPVQVREKLQKYRLNPKSDVDVLIAAEEVLAELAETEPNNSFVQRLIGSIRQLLRDLGFELEFNDQDLINQFILPARRFVESGAKTAQSDKAAVFSKSQSGDTIEVDGKFRSRLNANGKPIANTDEAIRNFWRWFGDSKVVDDRGRPLVVYHGSPDTRFLKSDAVFKSQRERLGLGNPLGAHWFASSLSTAKTYADPKRSFDYQNAEEGIVEAYLKLENPLVVRGNGQNWRVAQKQGKTGDLIEEAVKGKYQGVIIREVKDDYNNGLGTKSTDTYVVFESNQIKSATGNQGSFSAVNPDIRFSQAKGQQGTESARRMNAEQFEKLRKDLANRLIKETGTHPELAGTKAAQVEVRNEMRKNGKPAGNPATLQLEPQPFTEQQLALIDAYNNIGSKAAKHLYHSTPSANLQSIRDNGLMPGKKPRHEGVASKNKVSLGLSEKVARLHGQKSDVILRTQKGYVPSGNVEPDLLASGGAQASITTDQPIPASALEVKQGGKWVPLVQADQVESTVMEYMPNETAVKERLNDFFKTRQTFNSWWHKTIGTQYHKAQKSPEFKKVYDLAQGFIAGVSRFANDAADLAPTVLPRFDKFSDLKRKPISKDDNDKLQKSVFDGTLLWTRDASGQAVLASDLKKRYDGMTVDQKARELIRGRHVDHGIMKMWQGKQLDEYEKLINGSFEKHILPKPGIVFTPKELRSIFGMTDGQVALYKEFRAATDKSINDLAITEMINRADDLPESEKNSALVSRNADSAALELRDYYFDRASRDPENANRWNDLGNQMITLGEKAQNLIDRGYAPLMRFGKYSVYVTRGEEQVYFGLFESESDANKMARELKQQEEGATVQQGILSEQSFKIMNGMTPDTLELFAELTGADRTEAFADFIKLSKNNRSAMKRLLERKGVAGFSTDATRVLASFITSNARGASGNLHMNLMREAASNIDKQLGDVKDEAIKLMDYVQNPIEEAAKIRGLLFVQYIGGSIASAMVNLTQPMTMTVPFLSQFIGTRSAGKQLGLAMKDALSKKLADKTLQNAVERAEKDGIVSPQEIHQIQGEATRQFGNYTWVRRGLFLWGSLFGLAEQYNRRVTFIAAYRTALETKQADPYQFAVDAIAETQGVYTKANKPNWARGAVGSTLFTFKQFSISYLEFLKRLPPKERALALAILVVASGVQGLPFADDLDDLIDTIAQAMGYAWNSKEQKTKFVSQIVGRDAAEFVMRGGSAMPGFPIDVAGRMGMSNLLPGTGMLLKSKTDKTSDLLDVLGPAGGVVRDAIKGEFLPIAFRNAVQGVEMGFTGYYKDGKGRNVLPVTGLESVAKGIGFQPATIARESRSVSTAQQNIALVKNIEADIADDMAQARIEGSDDKYNKARKKLQDWNSNNPEAKIRITPEQIARRIREIKLGRAERVIKSAPKEIRNQTREAVLQ
jgi:Large polyvalent protein-associated domain 5/ADP-Ribosyltransferase in polyvalent proteins/Large polyvalent protein-associated domain 1